MMLVGLVVAGPLTLASGPLPPFTATLGLWLAGSGLGGVAGLLFIYRGLAIGKVGVVSALSSTEGAIAAVIAVFAGEHLTVMVAVMLGVIAIGITTVALATGAEDDSAKEPDHNEPLAVAFGVVAALCFGVSVYCTAEAGLILPPFAAVLGVRVIGVVLVFVPMALTGKLRMTRQAAPMVVVIGIGEVLGNASYIIGARESIAISAVLASQFAALVAVAAFFLFRERLTVTQRSGVVAIVLGVAVLSLVRG
jgi:drug/metabolite transporter (DMT)-like permease